MKWTPEQGTNYVHLVLNVKLLEIETLHVLILGSCYMQKYLLIVWYSLLRAIQVYHWCKKFYVMQKLNNKRRNRNNFWRAKKEKKFFRHLKQWVLFRRLFVSHITRLVHFNNTIFFCIERTRLKKGQIYVFFQQELSVVKFLENLEKISKKNIWRKWSYFKLYATE